MLEQALVAKDRPVVEPGLLEEVERRMRELAAALETLPGRPATTP